MEPFPTSEISVLVYRFLLTNGCQDTATTYLKECPDLYGIRCIGGFGSQAQFGGLPEVLRDYGKTRLIVKELTENLLTKWKALQEDVVTPLDSLTTQIRHIGNLFRTIYSPSPSPVGPRTASLIKTKKIASTCTSEDNVPQDVLSKKLYSISTQTELLVRNSTETQTEEFPVIVTESSARSSSQSQTIETQLYKSSGNQTSVDMPPRNQGTLGDAKTSELESPQLNTPVTPKSQTHVASCETPDAPTPQTEDLELIDDDAPLTERERAKIQIAFMNTLLSNNEAQEKLANTCTRQISTGTGSQETDELENGASAALTLSATASDVLESLLRDFDLMDGAESQDCNDVRFINGLSSDKGDVEGNSALCTGVEVYNAMSTVVQVIREKNMYSVTLPETEHKTKEPSQPGKEFEIHRSEDPENTDSLEPGEIRDRPETPPVFIDIADSPKADERRELEGKEETAKSSEQPKSAPATLPPKKQKRKRAPELVQKRRSRPIPIQTQPFPDGLEGDLNSRDCEIPVWNLLGRRGITPRIPNPSVATSQPESQPENKETTDSEDTPSRLDRLKTAEAVQNIPKFDDHSNSVPVTTPLPLTPAPEVVVTPVVSISSSKKLDGTVMSNLFSSAQLFSESHVSIAKPNVQERKSYSTPRKKNNHVRNLQFSTPPSVNKILHTINEEELNRSGLSLSESFSRKRPATGPGCQSKSKKRLEWTENVPETKSQDLHSTPTKAPASVAIRRNSALDSPEAKNAEEDEIIDVAIEESEPPASDSVPQEVICNPVNLSVLEFNGVLYTARMINGQVVASPMASASAPISVSPEKSPTNSQTIEPQLPSPAVFVEVPQNPVPCDPLDSTPTRPTSKKSRVKERAKPKASPRSLQSYDDTIQSVLTSAFEDPKETTESPTSGSCKKKSKGRGTKVSPTSNPPIPKLRIRLQRKSGEDRATKLKAQPQIASSESGSESPLKTFTLVSVDSLTLPPPPLSQDALSRILHVERSTDIPAGPNTITFCQADISQPLPDPSSSPHLRPNPDPDTPVKPPPPPPESPSVPSTSPKTPAESAKGKARLPLSKDRALVPQESELPESHSASPESLRPKPTQGQKAPEPQVSKSTSSEPITQKPTSNDIPGPNPKSTESPPLVPQSFSVESWPAPPTPRFLRRGEAVSDWDSLSSAASCAGAFEPVNFAGNLYSLMTPIKSGDAVPMTPGRGGRTDLPFCKNGGRGNSFLETPNLDLSKRVHGAGPGPQTELNTPNPKLLQTSAEIRPPVPVESVDPTTSAFVPAPSTQPLTFTSLTGPLPLASNAVRVRYVPNSTIKPGPVVASKDRNSAVKPVKSTKNTTNHAADLPCTLNQPSVKAAVPKRPRPGVMTFKVGGREKNLTWSETESALTLLSIGNSVRMVPPSPVHMLPSNPQQVENVLPVSASTMREKLKGMDIEKILQRIHPSQGGKEK